MSKPSHKASSLGEERVIEVPQLVAYYVTNLIGAGIFVIPAIAQERAGAWVLGAWLFLTLCSWPMARIFARISLDYPNSNGILYFISQYGSPRLGYALSMLTMLIMIGGNPIMGLVAARYAIAAFHLPGEWLYELGIAFMLLSVGFNMLGLRNSARMQTALVVLTTTCLLGLVGLVFVNGGAATWPEANQFEVEPFLAALAICFFAFLGWENVSTIAPNVRDPERSFRLATLISVPLVGLLYLSVSLALLLATKGTLHTGDYAVLDHLVTGLGFGKATLFTNCLALVVVVLSTNAWVLAASRLLAATARDGHLPSIFARQSKSAIPFHALLALAVTYVLTLLLFRTSSHAETTLIEFVTGGFVLIYAITFFLAVRRYRKESIIIHAVSSLVLCLVFGLSVPVQLASAATVAAALWLISGREQRRMSRSRSGNLRSEI
ncbi:APC family permease [Allorhizobium undicola]|uniref:APC family permease n=1 Tax=Allorhizobium undicola TaxID=78527 RepID=UPI003D353403